jgi:hypothetical protein
MRTGVSRRGAVADHQKHVKEIAVCNETISRLYLELESSGRRVAELEDILSRTRVRRFLMRVPGIVMAFALGYGVGAGIL